METPDQREDTRNVIDRFKGMSVDDIIQDLSATRSYLEIAVENVERDFNMGTIVRTANAFNVQKVHIVGRKQWNKRGAMKTDAYLELVYHTTVADFLSSMHTADRTVIAVDIVEGSQPLHGTPLPRNAVLVFGAEGPGLSTELLRGAHTVVNIEQFGSTRSLNVGVAAGIAMYTWVQQHLLTS